MEAPIYRSCPEHCFQLFSSDSRTLFTANQNGSIVRWDVGSGHSIHLFETHMTIQSIAYSPAGELFAVGDTHGMIQLWYLGDRSYRRQTISETDKHGKAISSLMFSPDGRWLVSGSWDRTFKRWRVKPQDPDGMMLSLMFTSLEAAGRIESVAMDPDGKLLAAGDASGAIQVWQVDDQSLSSVQGRDTCVHTGGITSLAFSLDGQVLASASKDKTLKLWRVSDCSLIQTLQKAETDQESIVLTIAFSPDGRTLAAGDSGHTVRFWKAQP